MQVKAGKEVHSEAVISFPLYEGDYHTMLSWWTEWLWQQVGCTNVLRGPNLLLTWFWLLTTHSMCTWHLHTRTKPSRTEHHWKCCVFHELVTVSGRKSNQHSHKAMLSTLQSPSCTQQHRTVSQLDLFPCHEYLHPKLLCVVQLWKQISRGSLCSRYHN